MSETKKYNYEKYAEYQKEYNQKRKKCAFNLYNDEYMQLLQHIEKKGYKSINAYLLALVRADMSGSRDSSATADADTTK